MRSFLSNTFLLIVSVLFCLLMAEGGTRALQAMDVLPEFNKETLHKGFRRPDQTLNGKTVPSDNPILFHEYDPADPRINSVGHRGPEFSLAKTPGTVRIALLGDSVAYGFGVPFQDTFAQGLQRALSRADRPVEVLNFAVSGYGTEAHVELFNTKIKQYQPDYLLLAYVLNDPLPNNIIKDVVREVMKVSRFFDKLSGRSQFAAWVYLQYYNFKDQQKTHRNYAKTFELDETWVELRSALTYLDSEMQGNMSVAVFPLLLDWAEYPFADIHGQIAELLNELEIPAVDILQAYSDQDHMALRIHPQDHTHPNALGHSIATEQLVVLLREQWKAR